MVKNQKVLMGSIKTLTFHKGQNTKGRRTDPIPQLTCVGSPCRKFQPEVVQCTNEGDDGLGNIQWKCQTDIPESLRLGKVEVSCEGFTSAADKYILQGSCGLQYNLHPSEAYINDLSSPPNSLDKWINSAFDWIFFLVSITLLYSFIRSLLLRFYPRWGLPPVSSFFPGGEGGHDHGDGGGGGPGGGGPGGPGGGGGGGGWYGGRGPGFNSGPPPPYTKDETFTSDPSPSTASSGPGFWTGLVAGGTAAYLAFNARNRNRDNDVRERYHRTNRWDDEDDRGLGSSSGSMGEMRRATGFGGTSNR